MLHTKGIATLLLATLGLMASAHAQILIGQTTGVTGAVAAMVLHTPVQRYVFNVRATYQREAEKAITHLTSIGINRVAIVHVDDSFGLDGLQGAQRGLEAAHLKATVVAKFDRNKPDFSAITPLLSQAHAQAVMIIGTGPAVVSGIRAVKASGQKMQFFTLSNNASDGFMQLLGADAEGVIVSQVLPHSLNFPLVREAMRLARARNIAELSPAMLEGFAAAKVLVEALRRCGNKPTREHLQAALEGMRKFDLGGMQISYSPTNHTGLDFADLSIVSVDKKFRR